MPIRQVDGTDLQYYLISVSASGVERAEGDGVLLSDAIKRVLADRASGITDVFLASHGWKGDVPAAIEQYDRWFGEMVRSPDRAAMRTSRPGFRPLVIGLHWPSLPFGDEHVAKNDGGLLSVGDDGAGATETDADLDTQVAQYAATIADTPAARAAIRTILEADSQEDGSSESLPPEVLDAYRRLHAEASLDDGVGDLGAPPGADHAEFDPDAIARDARAAADAGSSREGGLLSGGILGTLKGIIVSPLQQLSFWKMKDRARAIGEGAGHTLLRGLQQAAPATTRFHLMGHSFGCIVVSATVAGQPGGPPLVRPVDSLLLVQGALSLWSFCPDIPYAKGTAGYFSRIVKEGLVRGPFVTTRSSHDTAVGKMYPNAAGAARQLVLGDDLPKYGGVGAFGAQGLGAVADDVVMHSATHDYGFKPGRVYNIESSDTIKTGGGFSGAHSDIAHPEVAHVMWQAVVAAG